MIPAVQLVRSLRYALRDMQGVKYSDYELLESINQAASMLYGRLSERYVPAVLKQKVIVVGDDGYAVLPADFVRIHQLGMGNGIAAIPTSGGASGEGTYRILGDKIYAYPSGYNLEYYYIPKRLAGLDEGLDVPLSMSPYIERISLALFGNNLEVAEQVVLQCSQILAAREVSHFTDAGPVQVLGGRI